MEWMDLKNYLMSYGKQYPDETKFMFEPDKPEDHIIESDEDMLGESTVPSACSTANQFLWLTSFLKRVCRSFPRLARPRRTHLEMSKPSTVS